LFSFCESFLNSWSLVWSIVLDEKYRFPCFFLLFLNGIQLSLLLFLSLFILNIFQLSQWTIILNQFLMSLFPLLLFEFLLKPLLLLGFFLAETYLLNLHFMELFFAWVVLSHSCCWCLLIYILLHGCHLCRTQCLSSRSQIHPCFFSSFKPTHARFLIFSWLTIVHQIENLRPYQHVLNTLCKMNVSDVIHSRVVLNSLAIMLH